MMTKYLLLLLFTAKVGLAFQPPSKSPTPVIKGEKTKSNKFIETVRSMDLFAIQRVIDKVPLTYADLYQLIQVEQGNTVSANLAFWMNSGTYFLMFVTLSSATFGSLPEIKSLQDMAAEKLVQDINPKRREQALKSIVSRNILLSNDFPSIKQEIQNIFNQLRSKLTLLQGEDTTQKVKIRQDWREKALAQLTSLWKTILQRKPSAFSAMALGHIADMLADAGDLFSRAQKQHILRSYINDWIAKRCPELLRITDYLRAKRVIQALSEGVKRKYEELILSFRETIGPLTAKEMELYYDFKSLLDATPETCPGILEKVLLQQLGSKAQEILKGEMRP